MQVPFTKWNYLSIKESIMRRKSNQRTSTLLSQSFDLIADTKNRISLLNATQALKRQKKQERMERKMKRPLLESEAVQTPQKEQFIGEVSECSESNSQGKDQNMIIKQLQNKDQQIFFLQKRLDNLNESMQEKIIDQKTVVNNVQKGSQLSVFHSNKESLSVTQLKELYIALITSTEKTYKCIEQRNKGLLHLLTNLHLFQEGDSPDMAVKLFRLKTIIENVSSTLAKTSVKDMELSKYEREQSKMKIIIKKHEVEQEKFRRKIKMLKEQIFDMNLGTQELRGKVVKQKHTIDLKIQENRDLSRQLSFYQNRVAFLMKGQIKKKNNNEGDKLTNAMTVVMRQSDQYKQQIDRQKREIVVLKRKLKKQITKITQLEQALQKARGWQENKTQNQEKNKKKKFNQDGTLKTHVLNEFLQYEIPSTLEFRTHSLKMQYSSNFQLNLFINSKDLLNDIMGHGSEDFSRDLLEMKNKEAQLNTLTLLTSQFLSFYDFADKLNSMIISIFHVMNYSTIDDLMINISKIMWTIFSAETVHFWMTVGVRKPIHQQFTQLEFRYFLHCGQVEKSFAMLQPQRIDWQGDYEGIIHQLT